MTEILKVKTKKIVGELLNMIFSPDTDIVIQYYKDGGVFFSITLENKRELIIEFVIKENEVYLFSHDKKLILLGEFVPISSKSELLKFKKVSNFWELIIKKG
jgi:hypothetical protein